MSAATLPWVLSTWLPFLPVWKNVSSLTSWLSDFHAVHFSVSSGCFFVFKFVVVLLLLVRGGTVYLPTPPSWLEVLYVYFHFHMNNICIYQRSQPFSSHGTHKLVSKILRHTKKIYFCWSDQKIGIILIHSHQVAIAVLAVVTFLFDSLREKRSVPLTKVRYYMP